ncbi:ESX secretion-associated protein EspG [Actinokineospora auranticolor]|uniref:ESAT-6 protein secretion system EspG family protein n=1 Tax=Actinokineospora auranticolor TaxID=155976 RepID=A0A2S6GRC9_9PSEU|nr:ESX secretion-associated protein EspG [Actinokineospora auranticolor]PPK67784.1 ESAT-6 protein secretion system EspG family protein [Actinokineospora auranticolor]
MPRSFALSLAALDVLTDLLELNVRLFPFKIPSFGEYMADRARIGQAVFADLAGRGLIRYNQIDPDVEAALRITSDHQVGVGVLGTVESDRQILARGAVQGGTGVLAVQEGQMIRFELVGAAGLARVLSDLLPRMGAGPGQSVMVTQAAPVRQEPGFMQQVRAPRSSSDTQLRLAAAMLERPRTGYGFFSVTGRGRHGRELDAGALTWIDTDAGRYLSLSRPQPDGATRITYSPADTTRFAAQLNDLITAALPRD